MHKVGFDNDKYVKMQSEHIRNRIFAVRRQAVHGVRRQAL